MPKEKMQEIAHVAYVIGGWATLPICLVSTVGAFVAVNFREYQTEFLLVVIAAWSGHEFCKFYEQRKGVKTKSPE